MQKKVAIVTGAAHGIGNGIAWRLADEGWEVVAADLEATPEVSGVTSMKTDVTKETDLKMLVARTRKRFGRIDAIVSNAGIGEFKPLAESTLADWNRVIATNLTPAFLLAREAEQDLRAAKGAMVLVSSTRAHMSEPDTHAYSATKGGLVALTHSLAVSLGPDVRVNCVSPGWINVSGERLSKKDHSQHPVGRVGTPDDIAAAVSFLLSEQTGFITGAELIVDGGMTRKMIYH
ncbi:SDR family oxidoreductase [Luteolibacter luteus]|uniref:SDR family oxidoreductase n=1 Tax=Luteolibacter luteus TaxID=2728835 RepID=A0A858RLH3_9BACT|nr:SDR family oxidoreductase [Luteolibacter luteus]QJE98216.1 SDR family oxidoreductase [Luteolibacter luteus]